MRCGAELSFLQGVMHKFHLQTLLLRTSGEPDYRMDMGLRKFLGREDDYERFISEAERFIPDKTVVKLTDSFGCAYVFMLLPDESGVYLSIGPYLRRRPDYQRLMEFSESRSVHPSRFDQFIAYFESLPLFTDESPIFYTVNTFAEMLWGGSGAFRMVDVDREQTNAFSPLPGTAEKELSPEETLLNMQLMESRYSYENEILEAVGQGQIHRAEQMFAEIMKGADESSSIFRRSSSDPVRNIKNYAIIMNTLFRKAAEQGGVHPVYLNSISGDFAIKIETVSSVSGGVEMMQEMVRSYCRLVRRHSILSYSSQVQKAIVHIDSDLSGDLSLATLAEIQGVSASHLSTVFKRETGQTVTEHISQKRIDLAVRLLNTTRLQIQAIAQQCGFSDVNYFSKSFKKYTGMTPRAYRSSSGMQKVTE